MTLTSIAARIYHALLSNQIESKIEKIFRKNQNGFRRNQPTISQILTIRRILKGVCKKNVKETLLFVDFSKALDSLHRGKMEQILLTYGLPKETITAIMMLYKNTNAKVRSPRRDADYFDIVAGVRQGDTLAPYLFIICLDDVHRTSKNVVSSIKQVLATTPHETPTIRTLAPHHENYTSQTNRHAGHCWRSKDELISDVLLWTPTYGCAKVGRPARTYIQQLCEDTGCNPEDLPEAMNDREKWRERVRDIRAGGAT